MKRFPWRLALVFPLMAMTVIACDPTEEDEPKSSYPSDGISVDANQNIFVAEVTSVACGDCIATQEVMEVLKALYPGRIIPMSLHSDTLTNDAAVNVFAALGYDQTNPFLLFINQSQVASDPYVIVDDIINQDIPATIGIGHATRQNDTAWIIYPKVQFYADNQSDLYVQSYVMMSGVPAKAYGGLDLTQRSNDSRVGEGSGGNPTTWRANGGQTDVDQYLYSNGTVYTHEDALLGQGVNDTNIYGLPLSVINPLGQNFFLGDQFGNQFTPIEIYVPKGDFNIANAVSADLKVVTIVWQRIPGSPDVYAFVNGYYSDF